MAKFLIPPPPNPEGQAKLILKGAGLGLLKPKFYRVNESEIAKEQTDLTGSVINANNTGKFGLPIFDEFRFNCDEINRITYNRDKESGGGQEVIVAPFIFETALIEVTQTKNIVKTSIAGTNGTVKEYMSEGDYIINLKGVIVGDIANQQPEFTKIQALVAYLKAPVSIPIYCNFLTEFKINSVVIESYKLGQREGARNVVDIEINMLSDSVIELSSTNTKKDVFTQRSMF